MSRGRRAPASVLLLALAVAACRSPSPVPELPEDIELGTRLPADDPRPAQLLAALSRRGDSLSALRGRAHLSLDGPDLRFRRPQRMALERPDHMRVEILGLFGTTAAILVTRDGRFQFFQPGDDRYQEGAATRALLWELVRVDLTPEEVVALALGVPLLGAGRQPEGAERFDGGRIALRFVDPGGRLRERLWFDADARLVRLEAFDRGGRRESDVRWRDYRSALDGTVLAHEVDLVFPRVDARALLRFSSLEVADTLPPELFRIER